MTTRERAKSTQACTVGSTLLVNRLAASAWLA